MSASVIRYRKLVTTEVARQAVNLAESGTMGHRVQIPMSVDDMNSFFVWDRPAGSDRAVGHFNAEGKSVSFDDALSYALSRTFTDVDGVTNGLNFSSAILDANTDSRIRKNGSVMANDIVMAYVIYKCYGSSSAPTEGVVYNLQDAHDMLSNGALVSAIHASLSQEEAVSNTPGLDKGAVDAMFRDLLAADPSRFFDSAGKQVPGLFETSVDTNSRGSWGFVQNDKIEIAVQMKFLNPVTRRSVDNSEEESETVVIAAGSVFKIRLQIVATDTPSGAAAKQEVAKTEMAMSIAEQAAMTAKAAANAAAAQRTAAQAMAAAAAQTAAAQERLARAVDTNKKQATAAAKAVAASKAAQAALQLAITTGKTQTEIQAQRAAAVAAAALAENLEAIADVAATDLATAKLAADAAAATLAAAQTQAATAQAAVVTANAAAAKAAVMKAEQEAADLAAAKAAADAASDPLTKKIVDAEKAVLDPQTLVTLDAKLNDAKVKRLNASLTADKAYAGVVESTRKYDTARANLEYALSVGKKPEDIQIFKAATVSALSAKERAEFNAQATLSSLTSYYNLELGALQLADKAKVDAATLSSSVVAASVNQATRKVNMATTAYTYASTMTADALASATDAQTTLDARISGGAVFTEIQTRRKAVLEANALLAEVKVKSDAAAAALEDAKKELVAANAAAAAAVANISVVGARRATAETFYQSTITATKAYFAEKTAAADDTEKSLKAAALLTALNSAKDMVSHANAAQMVAKRNFDLAISSGKRLAEVSALREITQDADLKQKRAVLILQNAQTNFNQYAASLNQSVSSIMGIAAEFQASQTEAAKINSLASIYNKTFMNYMDAKAQMDDAKAQDDLVKSRLDNAMTSGGSLSDMTVLRQMKIKSSSDYSVALANYKASVGALVAANSGGGVIASGGGGAGSSGGGGGGTGSTSQTITTVAGTPGLTGFSDGNTTQGAVFNGPCDIVLASNGDMYVADTNNHCIRKVTPSGIVTTVAGNPGVAAYADGTGTNAKFSSPSGLDIGPDGNIYVADNTNNCIRKVTPSGVVTTFAGTVVGGSVDGTGTNASFYYPNGLTIASNGDMYVCEPNMSGIRKVTASGLVTNIAPNIGAGVCGLTVGPDGNIYAAVSSTNSNEILMVTPQGVVTPFVGSGASGHTDGTGTDASFYGPQGLEFGPDGNLYVSDINNNSIRKVTPEGVVTTFAGGARHPIYSWAAESGYANGTGTNATFTSPMGLAFAPNGDMYVCDSGNGLIRKVTPSGVVSKFVGSPRTWGHADGDGNITRGAFANIGDFIVAANGDIYVADTNAYSIRKVTPSGVITTFAGSGIAGYVDGTGTNAQFGEVYDMALGPDGNIYTCEYSGLIRKITPSGVVTTLAGNPGAIGNRYADGIGTNAMFYYPYGLAFGPDGNIYVADVGNNCIRKVTLAGVVTTVAGNPGQYGYADGTGTDAQFYYPYDLAFGPDGNIYVADQENNSIRKVTPSGVVTTIAGPADGISSPSRITVASNGDIYVEATNFIRKITSQGVVTIVNDEPFPHPVYSVKIFSDILYFGYYNSIQTITAGGSSSGGGSSPPPTTTSTITTTNYTSTITSLQTTSLVAGVPNSAGFADGSAREGVLFNVPEGMAIGPDGNFYVADFANSCIRKITPSGIVTVFVGEPGVGGSLTGTGTNARFNGPIGVAFASNGDMYVCVERNSYIAKVTPSGVVTLFAGTPSAPSYADGTGTDARFGGPQGLAVAPNGDIYVADSQNNCIRKITPDGVVTTFAGSQTGGYADGTGTDAQFLYPSGVAVASNGDIYVTDQINNSIRKITPSGVVTTLAGGAQDEYGSFIGGYADGTGTDATFAAIVALAVGQDGNIYVADQGNQSIRKVTPSGVVTTLAGGARDENDAAVYGYANGTGTNAKFLGFGGLVVAANGDIYVADAYNQVIRKITPAGVVSRFVGTPRINGYVDGDGNISRAAFNNIYNFIFAQNGDIYVADHINHSIRKVTPSGVVTTLAGSGTQGYADGTGTNAQFAATSGITFGPDGSLYVADQANHCIRKVTLAGVVTSVAGNPGVNGYAEGTGTDAQFWNPVYISFGPDGNMYVADNANHAIRKVTPSGVVTTLAGEGGSTSNGHVDGTGTDAKFANPYGLAVGPDGNIYVADTNNHCIRKVTLAGVVTTIAGTPEVPAYSDGTGTDAAFTFPTALAIAPNGDIYVADSGNELIRKITPQGVVTTVSQALGGILSVSIYSNILYWSDFYSINTIALTNNLTTTSTITTFVSTILLGGTSTMTSTITTYGPSLENPLISSILGSAIALRESETLAAKNSEYRLQAQKAYTELTAINIKYEKLVSEKEAITNKLNTALEGGKTLSEILALQKELAAKSEEMSNAQFYKTAITSTYQSASAKATPTQAVLTTLDTTKDNMLSAALQKKIDTASKDMSKAFVVFNAAKTEEAAAQGKYDVLNEELNTAIAQGADTADLLRKLNVSGSQLVEKKSATLRAEKGYNAALQTYNNLYNTQSVALPATFAMQGAEISTIMSTVTATTALSISSINAAKNNTLTRNLAQTYSQMMQLSTIVQESQASYDNITADFNAAIDQGKTLAEIQGLRSKLQDASKKVVTDKSDLISKTTAYTNSLLVAVESPGAKSILDAVALTQTQMAQGAKANALLKTLIEAKQLVFALNAEDAAAQSELLAANSAIQIATAGGSVPQEKYDAVLAASNRAASIRNKLLKANTAAMNAQLNVQMNPNVEAINALATTRYINQNAKAESNTLMAQYNEAKAKEAATYAALGVAKKTLETAAAAFDSAISSGTDLQTIQAARDSMNAAASQVNAANQEQTYAKAALNTAIANSKMSPVANSLVVTQRVNDENVVAGAKVTTEQYKLNLLNAELAKAQAASTAAAAAAATAKANLLASTATATSQEMVDLRSLATSTAEAASVAESALGKMNTSVLEQTAVVQTATAAFQATQDAVVANNIATFLLFNGFVFQQSVDRYVLNPSVLPASVTPGVAIPLDSITIMPLDLGAYDSTAQYTLGNVVSYPDFNGARYTCLVSSQDPRGASYTSIINKDPAAFPALWVQKEGPSLRYNAATDLLIPTPSVQGATLNVGIASGQMQGMQTLFTNSDINGNNTLLHGLTMFGPGLPSSTLIYPVTITLTGYTNSRANLTMTASNTLVTVSETTSVDYPLGLTATGEGGAIIHSPNSVTLSMINTVDSTQYFDVENNSISFSFKPEQMESTVYDAGFYLADNTLGSGHGFFLVKQANGDSTFFTFAVNSGVPVFSPAPITYTAGQTMRVFFNGSEVKYYLDSTLLGTTPNQTKNVRLQLNNNTSAPLRYNDIKAYTSQTQMKDIYIKNGKTILSAAVLAYNTYMANLATAGFVPDMRLGHLTESFIDTTKLPGTITAGTPFALGTTTITPTDKGLYNAATSYTTGDVVSDIYTSKYICLVGPMATGATYTITGNAPVETPGSSIYWLVIDNKSWTTFTYNSSTDLQLQITGFGSLLWNSTAFPPNTVIQLDSNFLQGFTLFGTGISQRTMVQSSEYAYAGPTYSYKLNVTAATSTDSTKTFYVKNAAPQLSSSTASKLGATLALFMNNAATNALAVVNSTTDAEATTNYDTIVNPGIATLAGLYPSNSSFMSLINAASTISNQCKTSANTHRSLLALKNSGQITVSDYNAAKTTNITRFTAIQTQVSSAASAVAAQNATTANSSVALITAEQANVVADPTVRVYLLAADYVADATTWNDKSGNGRNATLETGTTAKNSAGNGIVLNGSTSWTFPNVAAGNAWTISVWYKNTMATNGITSTSGIVSQIWGNGNLNIALGDLGTNQVNLGFRVSSGTWYTGANLSSYFTQNTWVNLVGTWNGTNLITYINNSLIENITPGGTAVDAGTNYRIGRRWDGANYVTGEIGEVRILSRALGAADVANIYLENFPAIMGLKAWYSAADYSGTGAWADKTGSGNSATILFGTAAKAPTGNAIVFDGATSWTFPNPAVGNAWTVSVWYKKHITATGFSVILSQILGGAMNIFMYDNTTITAGFKAMNDNEWKITEGIPVTKEIWTNIQTTWDGTTIRTYLNGALHVSATPGAGTISADNGTAYVLGSDFQGGQSNFIKGEIAEVRIYNRALPQEEITSVFNTTNDIELNITSGLQLWLDAKDNSTMTITPGTTTVTQWRDKSGLLNNATAVGTPQLGTTGIQFDNSSSFNLADGCLPYNDTDYTMYIIVRAPNGNSGLLTAGNGLYIAYDGAGARLGFQGYNGGGTMTNVSIQSALAIYTITYSSSGYNYKQYINGTQAANSNGTGPRNQTSTPNRLGTAAYVAKGMIVGEMLAFNGTHTTAQRQDIEGYLAWKWGTQATLPSSHPYYSYAPRRVIPKTYDLNVTGGLQLWLDGADVLGNGTVPASGSAVTTWSDKSGSNNNATGYGGLTYSNSSVVFNGTSGHFRTPYTSFSASETAFVVFKTNNPSIQQGFIDTSSGGGRAFELYGIGPSIANSTVAWLAYGSIAPLADTQTIAEYNYNSSGIQLYLNTTSSGSYPANPGFYSGTTYIGGGLHGGGVGFYMNGSISEVLIYNTVLTSTQREKVQGYLAWKWGIQSTLPSNHPYRNSAPTNLQVYLRAANYSGSGAWIDESGSGRDATLENGTIAKNAQGNGIVLNGSTSWTFPNVNVTNKWTANVWYKNTANHSAGACIVTQGMGYYQLNCMIGDWGPWGNTTKVAGTFLNGPWAIGDEITLVNNVWTNIQIVNNGTHIITYIDGTLLGSVPAYNGISAIDNGLDYLIGRGSPGYMVGEIGEVRIYNKALSASEVTAIYNESLATFSS